MYFSDSLSVWSSSLSGLLLPPPTYSSIYIYSIHDRDPYLKTLIFKPESLSDNVVRIYYNIVSVNFRVHNQFLLPTFYEGLPGHTQTRFFFADENIERRSSLCPRCICEGLGNLEEEYISIIQCCWKKQTKKNFLMKEYGIYMDWTFVYYFLHRFFFKGENNFNYA